MYGKSTSVVVALSIVFAAKTVYAADCVWIGGAEGAPSDWNTAANWRGGVPGRSDVAIFESGDWLITSSTSGDKYVSGIKVLSGNVYFSKSAMPIAFQKAYCPTGMLYVAEGATLCFSNFVSSGSATVSSQAAVAKYGAGTLRFCNRIGYSSNVGECNFRPFIAAEGTTYFSPNPNQGGTFGFYGDLVVKDGAEVLSTQYSEMSSYTGVVTVERGGILTLSGGDAASGYGASFASLQGEGTVRKGASAQTLRLRLKTDSVFSGTIENLAVTFPESPAASFYVGGSNTLASVGSIKIAGAALKFAPGVGEYWVKAISGYADSVLSTEDTDGNPIRIHLGTAPTTVNIIGTGDVVFTATATAKGSNFANTGALGTENGTLTFGDGSAAANDFDFSPFTSIFSLNGAGLTFKNVNATTIAQPIVAHGPLTVSKDTVFADLNMNGGDMTLTGDTTINGGDSAVGKVTLTAKTLTVGPNARVHGTKTMNMNKVFNIFTRPREQGINADFTDAAANVNINGGYLAVSPAGTTSPTLGPISIRNGGMLGVIYNFYARSTKTLFIDGGTIRYSFASALGGSFGSDAYPWRTTVGAQGGRLDTDYFQTYSSGTYVNLYMPTDTAPGVETDGGMVFALPAVVSFNRAWNLKGPVALKDGFICVNSGAYKNGAGASVDAPFGAGDLELGNVKLVLNAQSASRVTPLACGAGAKLTISGATMLSLRDSTSYTPQSAVIGPSGAAECPIVRTTGGVLYLREIASDADFDGTHGTVKVNGGVPLDTCGRVTLPVFTLQNSADAYNSMLRLDFTKYDAAKGLVRFTDYTAGLDGGADSVALVDGRSMQAQLVVDADVRVAALNVIANNNQSFNPLSISSGKTLFVGNGIAGETACVLLNSSGNYGRAGIKGSGTIDFGASEGVFGIGTSDYAHAPILEAKISGSGGVTYAGQIVRDYPYIEVKGNNDYTGGTFVNAVQVRVFHANALGKDTVRIGDGMLAGGQVRFDAALTVTNDFSISGNGVKWYGDTDLGALWFGCAATLTGNVEIRDRVRVSTSALRIDSGNYCLGGAGTFKGVVSGGALQIMKGVEPIILEGKNTYTGGTEILSGKLILRGEGTAGTGPVILDNGVLRFENTVPMTFANTLDGVGRIEIAGSAPVTFAGEGFDALPVRTLYPGSSVGYPDCADPTYVLGGELDIDLKGRDITVAVLCGSGTIAGGTVTVTGTVEPGGSNTVGTISFDRTPVLAGATVVIETEDGVTDQVVVSGDADISATNLRIVQLGKRTDVKAQEIFECEGTLKGPFAAVEKPVRKGDLYTVGYGECAATLDFAVPGLLLMVR